jgi:Ca2+-transporting ATPase
VGAWRLASRGMLVRRLASVETLGSTTVICTTRRERWTRGEFQMTQHLVLEPGLSERDFLEAAGAGVRTPSDRRDGTRDRRTAARPHAESQHDAESRWVLVRDYDFDVGKHMSHVWHALDITTDLWLRRRGPFEGILTHSTGRRAALGARRRTTGSRHRVARARARGQTHGPARRGRNEDERDLTVAWGFRTLRPEVPALLRECQRASIRITMITGDHA